MKEAIVAIEDQRFYEHRGIDFQGIGRAVVQDILHTGATQGASTITQQFVKNALRAQDSRTVFEKLREAALAYQLERHWDKDKILTEYLNEIYFGEGAYGIEEAAEDLLRLEPPRLRRGRAIGCAAELLPWEAALLAGMISTPSGYDPRTNPEDAARAPQPGAPEDGRAGLHHPGGVRSSTRRSRSPSRADRDPDGGLQGPLLHLLAAPAAGRQVRRRRGVRRRAPRHSTLDLDAPGRRSSRSRTSRTAGVGLNSAVVVLDNATGGVRAMVGGNDYSKQPVQPRHPGPAPARLLVQAVHAGDRARAGPLARPGVHLGPAGAPVQGARSGRRAAEPKVVDELFHVNNYDDQYLGSASIATATTYSDNSVYSQLGIR